METAADQADAQGAFSLDMVDDQISVDITSYYVSCYPKGGLSAWIGAAHWRYK
jgi:hypothetical protein